MFYKPKKKKRLSKVLEVLQHLRESDYKDSAILHGVASADDEEGKIISKTNLSRSEG